MSKMGGFDVPILHGLASFGIAGKHILSTYGKNDPASFKTIKARFAKHVFPGETLETQMWREGSKVIFQVRVVERDAIAISNAAVELAGEPSAASGPVLTGQAASGIAVEGFLASAIFEQIKAGITTASPEEKKAQVSKVKAVFQMDITNKNGATQSWYIDLKNGEGEVGLGKPTKGKPDVTIAINDPDFVEMAAGKLNAQKAFMQGKIKIKGNMMLATKLGDVLTKQPKAKI